MSTAEFEDLRYELDNHVGTITFCRPDRLNAFRAKTMREFLTLLDRVDGDNDVRAVIVTGEGRAFCAGADVSSGASAFEPTAATAEQAPRADTTPRDGGGILALRIHAMQKPVIAAINGPAVGMGATMTLPMDVRLASTKARFGFVFVRRGIIPEGCSSWFLPRVVGIGTASEWMLTGRIIESPEALDSGLVRSLHEPADLLPVARELAHEISDNAAPVSAAMTRQLLWRMLATADPLVAHHAESRGLAMRSRSDDAREGVESFLAKRPPRFTDRLEDTDMDIFED